MLLNPIADPAIAIITPLRLPKLSLLSAMFFIYLTGAKVMIIKHTAKSFATIYE